MNHPAYVAKILLRVTLLMLVLSPPAYAYVDPGSALLALQTVFAGAVAVLAFAKRPWKLLMKLFRRKGDEDA